MTTTMTLEPTSSLSMGQGVPFHDISKTNNAAYSTIIAREESTGDLLLLLSSSSARRASIDSSDSSGSPLPSVATSPRSTQQTISSVRSSDNNPAPILKRISSYVSIDSANKSLDASISKSGSVRRRGAPITITGLEVITDDAPSKLDCIPIHISTAVPAMRRNTSMVSFNSVDVRDYAVTLGDNPSCETGPALALDWSYHERPRISVDEYETSFRDKSRLHKEAKRLAPRQRENILKTDLGFTDEQLKEAEKEKQKIQRERTVSSVLSPFWRVESALDTLKEKVHRRKNKRQQQDPLA